MPWGAIKTNTALKALNLLMNPFSSPALAKFVKTSANSSSGLQRLGIDLPEHQHLLYEDKDKHRRFSLAPRLQYWENTIDIYAKALVNFFGYLRINGPDKPHNIANLIPPTQN